MSAYIMPILFLAVVFVAFALFIRNRYRSCADCSGDCDKSSCEKRL
ncbi:MAG: hypothetical protein HKN57_08395 [Xanthomonadales bacterium]|nr:hypothetical protein [Gammaproteobacteria bacterium]NND57259.1 hypothetical protein [Xanthomonadales bacterium]NNK52379.1 hypothetical protein [Xanthomonadales bacterium]